MGKFKEVDSTTIITATASGGDSSLERTRAGTEKAEIGNDDYRCDCETHLGCKGY